MLDDAAMIEVHAQEHPLRVSTVPVPAWEGQTLAQIVAAANMPAGRGLPQVRVIEGVRVTVVPVDWWGRVRPKRGTRVEIGYETRAPFAALGAALISAAAPAIAGGLFGLTGFAYYATVAAITVVGGLIVNALVPPPQQPSQSRDAGKENYFVTGTSNQLNAYGVYPKVLGRHRIYPPMSARGYSETTSSGGTMIRARYAIGWGPVAIEDMRFGDTPITQFEGVQVEFLNVDQSRTLANISGLSGITFGWRTGTERMRLYPLDIHEEGHDVLLENDVNVVRETAEDTEFASVDFMFKRGLVRYNKDGDSRDAKAQFRIRYREAGSSDAWTDLGYTEFRAKSQHPIRFTYDIDFPEPGKWEIDIRRSSAIYDDPADQNTGWLSGIRSRAAGRLPSHEGIAEIVVRVIASDQLQGQINAFNCVVQQLAPRWTGSAWTAPEPVRHPAWVYLDAIRGPHLRRPVPDSRIDLAAFKAWADSEPHWTFDYVVDTDTRVAEVLGMIAAAGRARPALTDLRYSIIRDGAQGVERYVFTPRNSWGFSWELKIPRAIHALRCIVRSEAMDWEQDEITVYADGYNAANASEFETLELPGVVQTSAATTQGSPWRLGRYHLAQAILRPESFEWWTDWLHLRFSRGDKVRIVHDVAQVGVGTARVQAIETDPEDDSVLVALILDDVIDVESDDFRVTVWKSGGTQHEFTGTSPADPHQRRWVRVSPAVAIDAGDLSVGDEVTIEETTQDSLEVLITGIYPDAGGRARMTAVLAAPEVLDADSGTIPDYEPIVTTPRDEAVKGPPLPVVRDVYSDERTMERLRDGSVRARIGVLIDPPPAIGLAPSWVQLRWRETDSNQDWTRSDPRPVENLFFMTGPLIDGRRYDVELHTEGELGQSRGWVTAGPVLAQALSAPPPDVTGFSVEPTIETEVVIRWERPDNTIDLDYLEIRYSASPSGTWNASTPEDAVPYPALSTRRFARPGLYLARWVDGAGRRSVNVASVYVSEDAINALNVVETWAAHPGWSGTLTDAEVTAGELGLVYGVDAYPEEGVWESDQVTDLGAVYPCRVRPFIEARGVSQNDNVRSWGNLREITSIRVGDIGEWRVEVDVAVSDSDPTGGSDWKPLGGGVVTGRYFRFRLRLYSLRADVTPIVSEMLMVLDMPDRVLGDKDVTVPAAGLRIDFDPPFTAVKSVIPVPVAAGLKAEWTKDRSGFDVLVRNAAGTAVEADIDWQALGYGREIVAA